MKYFISVVIAIFLSTPLALAENTPKDNTSKEQKSLEAQSTSKFSGFVEWLKSTDGNLGVNYNYVYNGTNSHNIDVGIEMRLIPKIELKDTNADYKTFEIGNMFFLPIEIRIRARGDGDWQKDAALLKDLKAGIARFIFQPTGFTLQLASFVMKNFDHNHGTLLGVEVAGLTYSHAAEAMDDGKLDIIVKGRVAFGGGDMNLKRNRTYNDTKGELMIETQMAPSRFGSFFLETGGSLGIRIAKRVLVEFFGGVNVVAGAYGDKNHENSGHTVLTRIGSMQYINPYFGGSIRVMATKWLHFVAQVKRSYHGMIVSFNKGDQRGAEWEKAIETYFGAEVKW
ncbi:MAG: hypothetical protein A2583_12865 [Bdellovibrionales bacterium RIFOXYD1_FULL_53_11]|nr:MAG: hypothetical protein A2583_12865 [Bdellovibrionales bacterium RIFOXYD1_FULL_53_11]